MRTIYIVGLLFFTSGSLIAGGGWPQPKGKGYFKLGQSWVISSDFYGPDGEITQIVTTGYFATNLYAEYGLTDRFTAIVYLPFFARNTLNEVQYNQSGKNIPGDALNSIGDTDIAIKYGLVVDKPVVVSATLLLGLPIGKTAGGGSEILQTGDGEFNQMIRMDVSGGLPNMPMWLSGYVGFNNRTEGFSDEIRFGGEVGYTFNKKLSTILKVNVVESLFNGDANVAENGIFSNNTEYFSPALEVAYDLKPNWGVSASGAFAFSGRNILASPMWGVGAYFKL